MNIYSIYLITNLVNGKQYVGYTEKTPFKRFAQHCKDAYDGSMTVFHKALRKYSPEKFSVECLYQTYDKHHALEEMEEHFIRECNTHFTEGVGYNMTFGGTGGDTSHSPNFKKYIAERNYWGENNPCYGLKHRYKTRPTRQGKKPANFEQWATASKGKSYYHSKDLQQEKRFLPSEVPQGWEKGRLKIACTCGKRVDISNFKKYHSNC
jgi:group I intron endonuclease